MKIMVFDVAAESGGALSILQEFYNKFSIDKNNEYILVLSLPKFEEKSNIKILRFPWIKKSWFHRLYFDYFISRKLVKLYKVDEILSLQNVIIPRTKTKQTLYLHNALPFSKYKIKFKESKLLWVYQNIISKSIYKSIKKADKVIVQTKWMKNECLKRTGVHESKIFVNPPKIEVKLVKEFSNYDKKKVTFFYPASAVIFKNHKLIIDACRILKTKSNIPFEVIFTLNGNENKHISKIDKIIKKENLPIVFCGTLSREQVYHYYSFSILIFPSYIESSPLPLTEAKIHNTPIITSDYAFSHEALDGYNRVTFINAFKANDLALIMLKYVQDK